MRRQLPSLFVCAALGCSASRAPQPARSVPQPPAGPTAHAERAPAALRQVFTGQARPSLSVKNSFPIAQHVFVDWQPRAVLAPTASQTFELSVGTHTITCADSQDPDDHPAVVTESFATGYAYSYDIHR